MTDSNLNRRARATALFKLAAKVNSGAVHRTLNRSPKGRGWIQAANSPTGLMCKPPRVREAIELFAKAYDEFPDIVALNQIALAHEMLGEFEAARTHFNKMRTQAESEGNVAHLKAAELGLARISQQ